MINQQLIDFINAEKLKGTSDLVIRSMLTANDWTESDLDECFNSIESPVSINNKVTPLKGENSSGKKILLMVLIIFVLAGGVSGYYFRNDLPIVKNLIKSKSVVISNVVPDQNLQNKIEDSVGANQNQIQQEPTAPVPSTVASEIKPPISVASVTSPASSVVAEKNCGVSKDTPIYDSGWEDSYEGDPALKCFGESAKSCTNAKVVITSGNLLDKNPAILQVVKNNDGCFFRFTGYEKKYLQCSMSSVKELDFDKTDANNNFVYKNNLDNSDPARYSSLIYNYASFILPTIYDASVSMPTVYNDNEYKNSGCTGDYVKAYSSSLNAGRLKNKEENINNLILTIRELGEIHFNDSSEDSGYKNVCQSATHEQSVIDKLKELGLNKVNCFDSKEAFAVSTPSAVSGFICADTTGFMGKILSSISGTKCQ